MPPDTEGCPVPEYNNCTKKNTGVHFDQQVQDQSMNRDSPALIIIIRCYTHGAPISSSHPGMGGIPAQGLIYMLTLDEIREYAGVDGLASPAAEESRKKYGANVMTPPEREPLWKQYLKNFDSPIIKILLFAVILSAIVSFFSGSSLLDTVGIIIAILLATGISFYNEYRSSREFDVLNAHRDDMAVKVIRDGHPRLVPSRDIVVGDLILLEAGDAIPADGWLLVSDEIFSDKSAFTGESEPVQRRLPTRSSKEVLSRLERAG